MRDVVIAECFRCYVFVVDFGRQTGLWHVRIGRPMKNEALSPHRDPTSSSIAVITLIHGTFARDAEWTGETSSFCKALADFFWGKGRLNDFSGLAEISL
jgi:hypothetical protein